MSEVLRGNLLDSAEWRLGDSSRDRSTNRGTANKSAEKPHEPFEHSGRDNFKRVARSALDCALAHWYMVPGLDFHRLRFTLELKSLFRQRQFPARARMLALDRAIEPASYIGFHFASKFLDKVTLGNYLDVASPWLFPFALLSNHQATSATLLTVRALGLQSLLAAARVGVKAGVRCCESDIRLEDDAYDTITSLWDPNGSSKQFRGENLRNLWRAVRPGGTLLLSVPCVKKAVDPLSADGTLPYDAEGLQRHIFDFLGQPKRYAMYGAQTLPWGIEKAPLDSSDCGGDGIGSSAIGRDWRCFSGFQELPGEGVIVLKFFRPKHCSTAGSIALTPRLN